MFVTVLSIVTNDLQRGEGQLGSLLIADTGRNERELLDTTLVDRITKNASVYETNILHPQIEHVSGGKQLLRPMHSSILMTEGPLCILAWKCSIL